MSEEWSIADLHRLGVRYFPPAEVHQILHDMAVFTFGVQSLTELDAAQRRHLAGCVRMHTVRAHQQRARKEPRKRPRGRPAREGVVQMISEAQRHLIRAIASELGWSESILDRCLQRHFGLASVSEVRTSPQASRVIRMLKSYKWNRDRACAAAK